MKLVVFILLSVFKSYAGSLEIIGPCDEEPLFKTTFTLGKANSNVGDETISILEKNRIPYLGTEQGINSIFDTPIGKDAYEVLSNNDVNAYGWCYSVNGISPEVNPHEMQIQKGDKIVWWFGYSQFKDGHWLTQCLPSYLRRAPKFCSEI